MTPTHRPRVSAHALACALTLALALTACGPRAALYELTEPGGALHTPTNTCEAYTPPKSKLRLPELLSAVSAGRGEDETGVYVIEDGGGALAARGWLTREATQSIDIQYFIFSSDHVGLIALQELISAARRGVRVRLIVDDLLYDGDAEILLAANAVENLEVRIYNPTINVGRSVPGQLLSLAADFRAANQRMHNKTFIVDREVVITGGRNVADEYFDFSLDYNFRDRDLLLVKGAAREVGASFDTYWSHPLVVPIKELLDPQEPALRERILTQLARLTCDPVRFWPEVHERIARVPETFARATERGRLEWVKGARFVWDPPGKNKGDQGLQGGGVTTSALIALVEGARRSVVIQTPYLVTTELSQGLFERAVKRGVQVQIITNSLQSTDNYPAFAGYRADRERLLEIGVELYEARPTSPPWVDLLTSALSERQKASGRLPMVGLHAKSMVVDGETLMVGTFNLDPRSAHLNTECVVIARSVSLAEGVLGHLRREMAPEAAWRVSLEANGDSAASWGQRWRAFWGRPVPKSIL